MNRRHFVRATVAGTLALGAAGFYWLRPVVDKDRLTIAAALRQLETLAQGSLTSRGAWLPPAIFVHCAQSVEYSMSGYPQNKSEVFRHTVGALAFAAFAARGQMTHPLDEPIPGAPPLAPDTALAPALARLRQSLVAFDDYTGQLAPHFAYGQLSKQDYALAHAMHLNNHMQEIVSA